MQLECLSRLSNREVFTKRPGNKKNHEQELVKRSVQGWARNERLTGINNDLSFSLYNDCHRRISSSLSMALESNYENKYRNKNLEARIYKLMDSSLSHSIKLVK